MEERREPFVIDQAKFSTQREVTYVLLLLFVCVTGVVLYQSDQSERSMVLQTVINLTLLAVGYWLGASKAAADSNSSMSRIAEAAAPSAALAVAAATATPAGAVTPAPPNPETGVIPAAEVAQPKGPS